MLPKPELTWREVHLTFGRRITLRRAHAHLTSQRKRRKTSLVKHQWVFTEDEFLRDFANLFVVLSPYAMYIKCREFDEHIAQILINCIGPMRDKTFALEMDGCLLGENALRSFFAHFSPSYLNLSGRFDRSLISDQVLPLSSLHSLFIGANVSDLETPTRISGVTVRKIVDNWSTQYTGTPSAIPADNDKEFYIIIPECDLKCDDILELFKELTRLPHGVMKKICIHNVPKTLIFEVARNWSTFDTSGFGLWVRQGLRSWDDATWWRALYCDCHGYSVSDSSQICDNIQETTVVSPSDC